MRSSSQAIKLLVKAGAVVLVVNELRGLALAAPVFLAMYKAGGTLTSVWLGVSALAGLLVSVALPAFAVKSLAGDSQGTPDRPLAAA
ncbi:MAG: hypothetical protein ABIT09_12295 [Croceibacterium sp.]